MQQSPWQNVPPPYGPPPGPAGPIYTGGAVEAMPNAPLTQGISVIESIKFVFTNDDWKNNLLIASVFMFIPILGPIATQGWHAEIMQRLVRGHPKPIPKLDFSDLMHYFGRGVAGFVVTLVLMMPFFLVSYFGLAITMFGGAALASATKEPLLMILAWVIIGFLYIFGMLTMITVLHAAMMRAELTESIGEAISPGKLLAILKKSWFKILTNGMLYGFLAVPIVFLGYAACIFGLYPAIVVISCGTVFLRYQIYRQYLNDGGEPVTLKELQNLPSEASRQGYPGQYPQYNQQQQYNQPQYGQYQGPPPPPYDPPRQY